MIHLSLKTKLGLSSLLSSAALLFPAVVLASSGGLSIPTGAVSIFSVTSVGMFVGGVLSFLFLIAGVIVFAFLVWGGLQWITSGGDKGKTQEARDRITAALVGLAIIAVAWALTLLLQTFFGINITNISLPLPY